MNANNLFEIGKVLYQAQEQDKNTSGSRSWHLLSEAPDNSFSDYCCSKSKPSNCGRRGDPRMHRAVVAKTRNPKMTPLDALLVGGFEFPTLGMSGTTDRTVLDTDNVLLYQRKNQLYRRLRLDKKRRAKESLSTQKVQPSKCAVSKTIVEQFLDYSNKSSSFDQLMSSRVSRNEEDSFDIDFIDSFFNLPETVDPEMLEDEYLGTWEHSYRTLNTDSILLQQRSFDQT
mmetsp:Transcript_26015/g.53240  ORF Transcript_26015/g.53240 Transcript_26015/m.53240 type:complete len:228 (-) Transcript_26015:197-880(-)